MDTKQAQELAQRMLADADATGHSSYDTVIVVRNEDGTYSEADNGDGVDGLTRDAVIDVLSRDLMQH